MTVAANRQLHRSVPPPDGDGEPRRLAWANELFLVGILLAAAGIGWAFPFRSVKFGLIAFFAIVMTVQALQRPAVALALTVAGIPAMGLIPPDIIPIRGVNPETLLIVFLLFLWARANQLHGKEPLRSFVARFLLLYAILILVSAFRSWMIWKVSLFNILAAAKNHLSYMVFYGTAYHVLRSRRDHRLVLLMSTASLFLVSLQAINMSWLAFFAGTLERHRAGSMLAQQPNIFGGALALYLPLLILLAINRIGHRFWNLWFTTVTGAVGFALILTLSRGAWAGAAAAVVFLAVFWDRKLLVLLLIMAASWQLWLPQEAVDRVKKTTQVEGSNADLAMGDQVVEDSAQMRVEQYKSLPAMMRDHPILGWGYKSYPDVFEKYGTLRRRKGAHTTYCLIGTEEGVVGLVVLFLLLGAIFFSAMRAAYAFEEPFYRQLAAGLGAGMLSMAICMLAGSRFESQIIYVYYWTLLAVVEREYDLLRLARHGIGVRREPVRAAS